MYDAIIVGARCAGSPTAMLLARRGYRVLLLDRTTFPSDAISNHYIHQPGVARLERWGLLGRVRASGCPPVTRVRFDVGPFVLSGLAPAAGGVREAYGPRRTVLDKLLVDAAVEAGAELRESFAVQELVWDGGRVVGIRGRQRGGRAVTECAQIVVGADGPRSFVARGVQAPTYDTRPARSVCYYSYWSGIPTDGVEMYPRVGRFLFALPTNDGLTLVGAVWPVGEFDTVRADIEGSLLRTFGEHAPGLAERVRAGRREERLVGSGNLPNFFRRPYGPGWALVGDAGYDKDPITAQGISDAFRDAELLNAAIDEGLSGARPWDESLAGYQRARDEAVRPMYEHTYQLAALAPPPPEMQEFLEALRGNQDATDRFLGTIAGTVPISEFFSDANLSRIIGRAQVRPAA
jgi:flavin-dependent dehydrogenase